MTKIQKILERLKEHYPEVECELNFKNPLELLVATILSAQCTDKRVNLVTKKLFETCKKRKDYSEIERKKLEKLIYSTGFFRSKANSIQVSATEIGEKHKGVVPKKMEELVVLPGVGRKTANVVLGNAYKIASGVVVDTHVERISRRLGLTKEKTAEKIEKDLIKKLPKKERIDFSHRLIRLGRGFCSSQKPRCGECFLKEFCNFYKSNENKSC